MNKSMFTKSFTISIHALREEGDAVIFRGGSPLILFLSTPSARRATEDNCTFGRLERGFLSTPSARRATPTIQCSGCVAPISIHALREEGDTGTKEKPAPYEDFYPRPPRGGRRASAAGCAFERVISIHALREEGDVENSKFTRYHENFYPRPPRGGRRDALIDGVEVIQFLSTPSARRATVVYNTLLGQLWISIHALREEGDLLQTPFIQNNLLISIHALREEGDRATTSPRSNQSISIHALREEGDLCYDMARVVPRPISIHALREEGDLHGNAELKPGMDISIHALREEGDV